MKQIKKPMIFIISFIFIIIFVGCSASYTVKAGEEALSALESDSAVSVAENGSYIEFMPSNPTCALVIVPPKDIEPSCFAWLAHELASKGYLTIIMTKSDISAASDITSNYESVTKWTLCAYDKSAEAACAYLSKNETAFSALVLYGGGPTAEADISETALSIIMVTGTEDGVYTVQMSEEAKAYLPANTENYEIGGANHAQFVISSDDTALEGDGEATITRTVQQRLIVEKTAAFMNSL